MSHPWNIHGQVGQDSEQLDLVEDVKMSLLIAEGAGLDEL